MRRHSSIFIGLALLMVIGSSIAPVASSEEVDRENELGNLIRERGTAIDTLEKEIAEHQNELKVLGGEKKSLQNQIRSLDITRTKLNADISVTENKISLTNYQLESLAIDIKDKEGRITASRSAIAEGLKIINGYDNLSFVENLLGSENLSDVWRTVEEIQSVQGHIEDRIATLNSAKADLQDKQAESTRVKLALTGFKTELAGQKKVVEYNKNEKSTLLIQTKNSEANYQKLLKEKVARRDAFERELKDFESELKLLKDPSNIPGANPGALAWPLDSVFITQYFGNTVFSRANPGLYNGNGHNGIDLHATVGTSIKAARDGEVVRTGDTDIVCPGASYGKWVLIKHNNGLSTLYGHLSVISVQTGDSVKTGSVIGFSGSTGYSTGPHLHFTVYATQGVAVMERRSRVCGGTYTMPIADLRAYLNPISYLPTLP